MQANKVPKYIHKYPFKMVQPYPYTFETHAKLRWIGYSLLDVLQKEFKAYNKQYYKEAIEKGNITINNKQTTIDYVVKNGDLLKHQSIRKEPPILDLPIHILIQNEKLLVVHKPPSIVVHVGGGFCYNSLVGILEHEMGYKGLKVLHRLDRLTSGVLLLGKNNQQSISARFHEASKQEEMKKKYYARVEGEVKWNEKIVEAAIRCISHKNGIYAVQQKYLGEKESNSQQKQQKQISKQTILIKQKEEDSKQNKAQTQAKWAKTVFKKIWYDQASNSSLIQCQPITGRTHQIRVHLKYIGHPILNDIDYNGKFIGNGIIKTIKHESDKSQECFENLVSVEKQEQELSKPKKKIKIINQTTNQASQWDYDNKPWQICLQSMSYQFEGVWYESIKPYWAYPDFNGYL